MRWTSEKVEKLTDQKVLAGIAKKVEREYLREAAEKRLAELKGAQE